MRTSTSSREGEQELRRLVTEGAAVRAMTSDQHDELWRSISSRARKPRRAPRLLMISGAASAATVWLAVSISRPVPRAPLPTAADHTPTAHTASPSPSALVAPPQPGQTRTVHLGSRGDLALWPDAQVTLPPGVDANQRGAYRVRLERGRIAAAIGPRGSDEPLAVVTPQLAVVVVGTRFWVEVSHDTTFVAVEEGRVRIERGEHTVFLGAGDSIRSDDPRLQNERPGDPCAGETVLAGRRACLTREAAGRGLAAENALFALGLLERDQGGDRVRAMALFREYQRRFPTGILGPEVALTVTSLLAAEGNHRQACAEADVFAHRFPRDQLTHERLLRICGR